MLHDIWAVVLIVGLVGWLFAAIMFMFKAFPRKDEFSIVHGVKWGAVCVVSFLIWVIGMLNA